MTRTQGYPAFKAVGNEVVTIKSVLESGDKEAIGLANRISECMNAGTTLAVTSTSENETPPPHFSSSPRPCTSDPTGEDRDSFMNERNQIWKQAQA